MRLAVVLPLLALSIGACSSTVTGTGNNTSSGGTASNGGGGGASSDSPAASDGSGGSSSAGKTGTSCSASKGECSCYPSTAPNQIRCSTTLLPGAVCCADPGWPSQGSCQCQLPCYGSRNSCSCGSVGGQSATCEGDVCCQTDTECRCESSALGGECTQGTRVASCTGFKSACTSGQTSVASCSSTP